MLQIINQIPVYILPLFIILLVGGLRARKANATSLKILLLLPTIFFTWSLFSFSGKYFANSLMMLMWPVNLMFGFFIGFFHMNTLALKFDKPKKVVMMPGSWVPLILSMSIFSSKFLVGMLGSMQPHLRDSFFLQGLELFSTIILGIFAGRGICCLIRYNNFTAEVVE